MYITRMNTLFLLSSFALVMILQPAEVIMMPVQSDSSNNANANITSSSPNPPTQNLSLPRYTAMVDDLVRALQVIHSLLAQHVSVIHCHGLS